MRSSLARWSPLATASRTLINIGKECVHLARMRDVEKMTGTCDHSISVNATNRNEVIAFAVHVMNRHR